MINYLLVFSHSSTVLSPLFILSIAEANVALVENTVVSSAKCTNFRLGALRDMSLIYNRNKIGPSIGPCGTPIEISLCSEEILSITTHCFLADK